MTAARRPIGHMTAARRPMAVLSVLGLVLAACGNASGFADTRRALERAGYSEVQVEVRSGGGVDVVRVDASGSDADRAAEVVWSTLPVRFDHVVVAIGAQGTGYSYEALRDRFGARDPSLDRRQVSDQVVRDGLELMVLLTLGALVSVGLVVGLGLLVLRAGRRARGRGPGGRGLEDQAEGPISGLGDDSPTPGEPSAEAAGPPAIPS